MSEPPSHEGFRHPRRPVQELLTIFLVMLISIFATGIVAFGVATNKIAFTGTIDATVILSITVVTGFAVIMRYVFGRTNTAASGV